MMLDYEWDPNKAEVNSKKHKIAFADAVTVFGDERAITIVDDHPQESRFIILGRDSRDRVLVVVFTYRNDNVRIISARKAAGTEITEYLKE